MLDPDSITIVLADQFSPDTLPPNTDESCTCLIRYHRLTLEDLKVVLSVTEVVEGVLVSIVNSQQTLLSQFHNKGLYLKDLKAS